MIDKTFDCVQMMHEAGEKILKELEGLTPEQEIEYWKVKTQQCRERQKALSELPSPNTIS